MNETQFKTRALNYLRAQYPKGFFWKASDQFQGGIPDIVGCIEGKFIAIELKVKGNKTTPLQDFVLNKLKEAGAIIAVCYSIDDIKELMYKLLI